MKISNGFVLAAVLAGFFMMAPFGGGPARAGGDGFLSVFEDLPLMPGLAEDTARGMAFDTPGGRVVEAVAWGEATTGQVRRFYAEALPQLGWRQVGEGVYRREGEELRLELMAESGKVTVRFASAPIGVPEAKK